MSGTVRPEDSARRHPMGLRTIMELFDIGRGVALGAFVLAFALVIGSIIYFIRSAPPTTLRITTGPEGSISQRYATRYADILKRDGVTLRIVPSEGSAQNLKLLADPKSAVDVGFVQSGISKEEMPNLVSLGSISYQPLMLFYRHNSFGHRVGKARTPLTLLSELEGKKIAIGPEGSGVRTVSLAILKANDVAEEGATDFVDWEAQRASNALLAGEIDAMFVMGESTPMPLLRQLLRSDGVSLYHFAQAAAYTRKLNFLNLLQLPEGAIDLGNNLPAHDVTLVGPVVELIAKKDLHPALSDLLLQAAVEVHSRPGLYQKRGEFPAPQEHVIRISEDAKRFYTSGKSFLYRYLPFWLASLLGRVLVAFVPTLVVLIPIMRSIPAFLRWRAHTKIRRHYRSLLNLERRWLKESDPKQRARLREDLNRIEEKVSRTSIRPAFADQFYGLRGHVSYVRALVDKG